MEQKPIDANLNRLVAELSRLWEDPQDRTRIEKTLQALDTRYGLIRKMAKEPEVEGILKQMFGRLARSFGRLSDLRDKRILDIACGSNTSKLPAAFHAETPFGEARIGKASRGFTALFEPWFCRILLALDAAPVGIDFGDLEDELFIHHRVDLGKPGALDFLPDHAFDGIQDSRLFGSPEFTDQFPDPADRLKIAREIYRQEARLLKFGGIIIHSDAAELLK